jgi:hypothetical protein
MQVQFYHECFEYNENFKALRVKHLSLDAERIVCPTCNGEGHHFRSDLDENDMVDSFNEDGDDDGLEAYQNGAFDEICRECNGKNIVDVPNWEYAPKWVQKAIEKFYDDERYNAEVHRAECGYQW